MSRYNREIKRGLAGIRGLNFAYRLNNWGPKNGPSMLPANAFTKGYAPTPQGLSGPITWVESIFGVESAANMLVDAQDTLADVNESLNSASLQIHTLLNQAQGYDSVTGADVQAKAQACQSQAVGLQSNLASMQTASQNIATEISTNPTDKTIAQSIKDAASALQGQVSTLLKNVSHLQDDVTALIKYAQSGPGAVQTLENAAVSSISTLTWIAGGGALIYLLAPTFIPRMIGGLRKAGHR